MPCIIQETVHFLSSNLKMISSIALDAEKAFGLQPCMRVKRLERIERLLRSRAERGSQYEKMYNWHERSPGSALYSMTPVIT